MPIRSFADKSTADIFNGEDSKEARRIDVKVRKAAKRRLDVLHAAKDTRDLSAIPGNNFENLKETKPGFYSIRANDQWRIIFRFVNGEAHDVYLEGEDHTGRRSAAAHLRAGAAA
jgi:proteic killer suppression protein